MAHTTTTENAPIPNTPSTTGSTRPYIETLLADIFRTGTHTYYEVCVTFNYGPHASSTGAFHLDLSKHRTTKQWPVRDIGLSLGPSKAHTQQTLDNTNYRIPDDIATAIHNAIDAFTPTADQLPKWSDRNITRPVKPDVHATADPAFLNDHPNLTVTDDRSLGTYTLPSADSDGVHVHRPGTSKHSNTEFEVQGAGTALTGVDRIVVDDDAFDKATEPPIVGSHRRFYPHASVRVEDSTAYITTDDGRQWTPQGYDRQP